MLASGIVLASIGGLAVADTASAAAIAIPIAHSATIAPNLAPTLNILPNFAPTLALTVSPTLAISPTSAISPTVTAPVLGGGVVLPTLPGL